MIEFHCMDCLRKVRHPHHCPASHRPIHVRILGWIVAPFLIAAAAIAVLGSIIGFWDLK